MHSSSLLGKVDMRLAGMFARKRDREAQTSVYPGKIDYHRFFWQSSRHRKLYRTNKASISVILLTYSCALSGMLRTYLIFSHFVSP